MNKSRIAWLLNSAFFYWHPTLSEYTRIFPETTVFAGWWKGYAPGLEDSFKVEVMGDHKVIPILRSSTSYGSNFTYLPLNIVNRLFKFKPDVIISNSFGVWTVLALLFKPVGRWKVVIAYEGSSPGVDYRNSAPRLAVRRAMVKAADACITNSQAGKAYLIEVLKAKVDRVFAKPYEVPDPKALLEYSGSSDSRVSQLQHPIFLFVGSIESRKGLNFLLEACAILEKQKMHNYTLLVVGDGAQREELEGFCRSANLTERVKWLGRVDYGQLGTFFSAADVFVLPTLEDTWGVVISEAMVIGKAILCSKCAGAFEIVADGENGYIFDPYDPEKLAQLMSRMISDPELVSSMGKKSQQLMTQYTPKAAAEFLAKVTTTVLEGH
ncbi:glycosyltransferase family 4 protein [Floridanema aerugineum]|uniref:Glycosyltransferase family 4 protein n=1 Tax=Floridaenema aerugineum BLCC-F46 TaxID=3153654 RepID=A0ABV4WXR9_9CYAN